MRLPTWMEYGNYGGPNHGDGYWKKDGTGEYVYHRGIVPKDGQEPYSIIF